MNYRSFILLCALGCLPGIDLSADASAPGGDTEKREQALLAPAQLDELLAPLALYPDPLIAVILPASTFPADVVLAARYLNAGGHLEAVESQPWDDSVKALARYPEVLKWLDENLAWTKQVGAAFLLQPADLLTSTQRLRAAARAAGNLNNTPEQTVLVERETIRVVPAQPEVIYVPVYDPAFVYRARAIDFYHPGPVIRFSRAYRAGFWLSYHCDWAYKTVLVVDRPHRVIVWQTYPRWSCLGPSFAYYPKVWCASPAKVHAVIREQQHRQVRHQVAAPKQTLLHSGQIAATPSPSAAAITATPASPSPSTTGISSGNPPAPAAVSASSNTGAPRLGRPSVALRPGSTPETRTTSPAAPSPDPRDRESRRARSTVLAPSPAPTPSPLPGVQPPPAITRRLRSTGTFGSAETAPAAAPAAGSRPSAPPGAGRLSTRAPETTIVTTTTETSTASRRRDRDVRAASSSPVSPVQRSASSGAGESAPPMSRARMRDPVMTAPAVTELESSATRSRR